MSSTAKSALQEFANTRDDEAFRRIVAEFGGLVISAAHRRTGDRQLAEEVAQNVFAVMARKARAVAGYRSIAAWVFTTTRLEAAKALRSRQRHHRKLEALAEEITSNQAMNEEAPEQWRDALPYLESGLDRLSELEREMLLARYFENRSFKQIADETGRSEAASKMRVRRALDKLAHWMTRRGVTLSTTAMTAGLSATWSQSSSAATISTLSTSAITAAPGVSTATVITNSWLTMNSFKSAATVAAVVLALGAIAFSIQQARASALGKEIAEMRTRHSDLTTSRMGLGNLTPGRSFQQRARLADSPSDLAEDVMLAMMEQDMGAIMRFAMAFAEMTPEEIEDLMIQVRDSEANGRAKDDAMRMLVNFLDPEDKNPGLFFDRMIEFKITAGLHWEKLNRWGTHDPAAAIAWFNKRKAEGGFEGDSADFFLGSLLRGIAKTHSKAAVDLLDDYQDDWKRDRLTGSLAGIIYGQGMPEAFEHARDLLLKIESKSDRQSGFIKACSQSMPHVSLDDLLVLARSLEFEDGFESWALRRIVMHRKDLPHVERADWLVAQIGETDPVQIRSLVTTARISDPKFDKWIDAQPPGAIRDHALMGEVIALAGTLRLGPQAIARARLIDDEEIRALALRTTLEKLPSVVTEAASPANEREAEEFERAREEAAKRKKRS